MTFTRSVLTACVGSLLLLNSSRPSSAIVLNPIQRENRQPGTTAWQLTNPADDRQIEGYASLLRIRCGYPWFHPGLVSCRHPAIEQITRNVLDRFIGR
jgi:hypothetical protein